MNKLLVFDYDGTIHDTLRIYEPAFRRCNQHLIEAGFIKKNEISQKQISKWLGMNAKDMWLDFQPDLSEQIRESASEYIGKLMEEQVRNNNAKWYENANKVLDSLKNKGYQMVILSNSKTKTGELYYQYFGMEKWFDKWYDSESFNWASKEIIIQKIKSEYKKDMVVIGDRYLDITAAKSVDAISIGCAYGYGGMDELKNSDFIISGIEELNEIL